MSFKMTWSPKDEKLLHNHNDRGEQNIFTLGRGSYTGSFDLPLGFGRMHVLGGRFCSLATGIYFSMSNNHSMQGVTTSPIDVGRVVKSIFEKVRP